MNNLLIKYLNIEEHGKDLYLLLIIGWLYSIGLFLSNTFVNIYLWRQTEDYFTIAFYHLSIYIAKSITFIIAGKIVKKIDRVIVLRLGVTFLSLFFLTVLYLQENAAKFNVLLGVLIGIGYGFYWLSFNVLTFEITEPFNRVFFNGLLGGLQSISGMIGPLLAGTIILRMDTSIGYMTIFTISFSFVCAIIVPSNLMVLLSLFIHIYIRKFNRRNK
jgi:YQGE family putative transporter